MTHRHKYKLNSECGAKSCSSCGYHKDLKECFCKSWKKYYVDWQRRVIANMDKSGDFEKL